jgi:hypothetical protein
MIMNLNLIEPIENGKKMIYLRVSYTLPLILSIINNIIYDYIGKFSYRYKNPGKIYFEIVMMYIILFFPYTLTNFSKNVNIFTILSTIITNFLFIFLGKIPFFDFVLSNDYSWKIPQIIFLLSITILYFLPIFYHHRYFYNKYTLYYITTVIVLVIISIILYLCDKNIKVFHIHHWIIGYTLLFLFRDEEDILQVLSGISLGTFIHGSITYGLDNIFS